ncbi:hypothetical protein BH23CHL5_BH23CHL5_14050 [soil metagenome]
MNVTSSIRHKASQQEWISPPEPPVDGPVVHEHPLLNALLLHRGIRSQDDARNFLDHDEEGLPDPFQLVDIQLAADRISRAVVAGERIGIFGDYDADGMTSTAILLLALREVAFEPSLVVARLPTRAEGYGLSTTAIDEFVARNSTLMIVVDCGSTDELNVKYATEQGLDVVIIDHHRMSGTGPAGSITISPARVDDGSYRDMSAAGLSLLMVAALETIPSMQQRGMQEMARSLVDLAAIGTVADVSSLLGVNRQIVRAGLRLIRKSPRIGIRVLCETGRIDWQSLSSIDIGFKVAPRLNAAGRIGDPHLGLRLLVATDLSEARTFAGDLEQLNRERRVDTDRVEQMVFDRIEASGQVDSVIIEHDRSWRVGILGLAAGKLAERTGYPVILLGGNDELATGSCRSVPGLDIYSIISRHRALLTRFGGHTQAAGLTIPVGNISAFRDALLADITSMDVELPVDGRLYIDADLRPEDVTMDMARLIIRLSPFGNDNPEPVFRISGVRFSGWETMGQEKSHLRLTWSVPSGTVRAPFFGAAYRIPELNTRSFFDVACTMSLSRWNGETRLDVKVLDFIESATAKQ